MYVNISYMDPMGFAMSIQYLIHKEYHLLCFAACYLPSHMFHICIPLVPDLCTYIHHHNNNINNDITV